MNLIKTFSAISGLSGVHRYSMMKLGNPESVLEHTGMVTLLSNLIAREINVMEPFSIDLDSMTLRALVHDLDELVVGDIPRPTKYHSKETREMFRIVEERGVRKVTVEIGISLPLQAEIIEAHRRSKKDREGLIVAIADVMAVVYKVWEEVLVRGNCSMARQARTVMDQLVSLRSRSIVEFNLDRPEIGQFVGDVIDVAYDVMKEASSRSDPIHGAIEEEMTS